MQDRIQTKNLFVLPNKSLHRSLNQSGVARRTAYSTELEKHLASHAGSSSLREKTVIMLHSSAGASNDRQDREAPG